MRRIAISSGHGLHIRGAAGVLDEVNEARRVVRRVVELLRSSGVTVNSFNDDTSTTQSQNLKTIVDYHNRQVRDLDVSVHFNAYQSTTRPMGTECLHVSQEKLATDLAAAMSRSGHLINRGAKRRTNLYFLNSCAKPAVLLEVCFVDSTADAKLYQENYEGICQAIAETIGQVKIAPGEAATGEVVVMPPPQPQAAKSAPRRLTLRQGTRGPEVVTLQQALGITSDGIFGPNTKRAVMDFQRAQGLTPDGVVGLLTWAKLRGDAEPPPLPKQQLLDQRDIKCSVFGGARDPNDSAYPPFSRITDIEMGCALPWRFKDHRPFVLIRNRATGYEAICEIRDIGPWLIDDEYWVNGDRPLAETCWKNKTPLPRGPNKGKVPNGAGIDITPGAAKAIGLSGMGQVDWRFVDQDEAVAAA
jgi:N-acetylmuramoyl-L-alanine amidase/Putative peptidoglycan binding domain